MSADANYPRSGNASRAVLADSIKPSINRHQKLLFGGHSIRKRNAEDACCLGTTRYK
jgi:hypothetical protein